MSDVQARFAPICFVEPSTPRLLGAVKVGRSSSGELCADVRHVVQSFLGCIVIVDRDLSIWLWSVDPAFLPNEGRL